tara:strand:+ start:1695 stop:1892 length:198 start_codon:yes stop_codon:yes gene_type:complete
MLQAYLMRHPKNQATLFSKSVMLIYGIITNGAALNAIKACFLAAGNSKVHRLVIAQIFIKNRGAF